MTARIILILISDNKAEAKNQTKQISFEISILQQTNMNLFLFFLQVTCLSNSNINYIQFLQEIAGEQQFEVTYVDIDEKTYSGQSQCLVQLSTLPVAVCQGCGKNSKEAQASAARNALEYLKIMTKM